MTLPEKIRKHSVDIGLIGGAILCFVIYAVQATQLGTREATSESLGKIIDGTASRKSIGRPSFESIHPYAPVYNRDVLWVEDSAWTQLQFSDGSVLKMKQGSMLVVTRSLSASNLGRRIELFKGEVEIDKKWHWFWQRADYEVVTHGKKITIGPDKTKVSADLNEETDEKKKSQALPSVESNAEPSPAPVITPSSTPEPSPTPTPKASKTPIDKKAAGAMTFSGHPKPGSILLKNGSAPQATVAFAWSSPIDGEVEIQATDGGATQKVSVKHATATKAVLAVEHEYTWLVRELPSGRSAFGPFKFRLYSTTKHPLGQLMDKETQATIEFAN